MATTSHPGCPLDNPDLMIASLPAVLGFVPEKSLVLVTAADGEMGAVLRIDLPVRDTGLLLELAETAAAAEPEVAVAVIVDAEGAGCRMCAEDYREWTQFLTEELAEWHVELIAAHVVDAVEAGGRWYCADGCGRSGRVADPSASPLALAAVLDGRRLYRRRADLVALVTPGDPDHAAGLMPRLEDADVEQQANGVDPSGVRGAIEHALGCAARIGDGSVLSDDELVRLGASLRRPQVRDTLYALAVGDRAGPAESLWAELSRRLPGPWRAEALVLLAFSAYARGDGPLAGIALDAALSCESKHNMAGMLDQALRSGMRPEEIRELARTGYRIAAELGIALPPRRLFGRRRAG